MEHGIKNVGIKIQGPGSGRDTAVKAVGSMDGVRVTWLKMLHHYHTMVVDLLKEEECKE